jgi:putative flavoprotein involved in K+ transport
MSARIEDLPDSTDVLVVGAGHAGLAMSGLLRDAGREHLVVEARDTLSGGWRDRWDEFTLVTPNWTASFPGWDYDGDDPHGFMGRDEIAARVGRYADVVRAPVALSAGVERLTPREGGGFRVVTSRGELTARQVVVATGSYHTPRIPPFAKDISGRVTQLHSHDYRNQAALPDGGVLVVGSGQTGLQLAEELFEAGRRVFVSAGSAGRVPRRYRGRDIFEWLIDLLRRGPALGVTLPVAEQLPDGRRKFSAMPALTGRAGGHDTNLRRYAADGMSLAGRLTGVDGERLSFAGDLTVSLERADSFFDERFRGPIDTYIELAGVDAPPADDVALTYEPVELTELNLRDAGISTVIWATGYGLDYDWIEAPLLDTLGYPRNERGVACVPGLHFLGLLWQHSQASASLVGPSLDGPFLVERMGRRGSGAPYACAAASRAGPVATAAARSRAGVSSASTAPTASTTTAIGSADTTPSVNAAGLS